MCARIYCSLSELKGAGKSLVLVDFYADWCGPCRAIAPLFADLCRDNPDVLFIKVNSDAGDASGSRGVSALPTFHFYISEKKVGEVRGGDPAGLKAALAKYKAQAK